MISPTSRRPEDGPGGTTGASRACSASGTGGTSTADSALADQALADQALADLALAEEDAAEEDAAEQALEDTRLTVATRCSNCSAVLQRQSRVHVQIASESKVFLGL